MGVDSFICGICQVTFHDIHQFLHHKNSGCGGNQAQTQAASDSQGKAVYAESSQKAALDGVEPNSDGASEVVVSSESVGMSDGEGEGEAILTIVPETELETIEDVVYEEVDQPEVKMETAAGSGRTFQTLQLEDEDGKIVHVQLEGPVELLQEGDSMEETSQTAGLLVSNAETEKPIHRLINASNIYMDINNSECYQEQLDAGKNIQIIVQNADMQDTIHTVIGQQNPLLKTPKTGRKRGRPKKGEGSTPKPPTPPVIVKQERPETPQKAADGKLHCSCCKKSFYKERHFITHRCLGQGDYVDITKRELLDEPDADSGEDEEDMKDDWKVPRSSLFKGTKRKRGRPPIIKQEPSCADLQIIVPQQPTVLTIGAEEAAPVLENPPHAAAYPADQQQAAEALTGPCILLSTGDFGMESLQPEAVTEVVEGDKTAEGAVVSEPIVYTRSKRGRGKSRKSKFVVGAEGKGTVERSQALNQVKSKPVFTSEQEKLLFQNAVNVDLGPLVDELYRKHIIEQDVNEKAPTNTARMSSDLNLFSCTVCEKVFMSRSHMRLHCIIHTDLKPFKCYKCDYATNNKGNLYSHMRRHTGQMYSCTSCPFKTSNRAHLVEHEMTHGNHAHVCEICNHHYSTRKSLIHHVREYHKTSKTGEEYLSKFQTSKGAYAVLHQCHVCNRKFKAKADRDRHLVAHNIQNTDNLFPCEMCEHVASRLTYLERHMMKHRVVYGCYQCDARFASTSRLNQHLSDTHLAGVSAEQQWQEAFQKCIGKSYFYPGNTSSAWEGVSSDASPPSSAPSGTIMLGVDESDLTSVEELSLEAVKHQDDQGTDDTNTEAEGVPVAVEEEESLAAAGDLGGEEEKVDMSLGLEEETLGTAALEEQEDAAMEIEDVAMTNNMTDSLNISAESGDEAASGTADEDREATRIQFDKLGFKKMNVAEFYSMRSVFGSIECPICGRLFTTQSCCDEHARIHTVGNEAKVICDQCGQRVVSDEELQQHVDAVHGGTTFRCGICEYEAGSYNQLYAHSQKHRSVSNLTCSRCQQQFEGLTRLKMHMEVSHSDLSLEETTQVLQQSTATPTKKYSRIGKKSYKCPYCPRGLFKSASDLQKHVWIHQDMKPFKCPVCPHATRSKNNLQAHMLRHSTEKPFACGECGKAYKSRTALRWHVRAHKDGKMFKCHSCPYEATQESHLRRHLETHDVLKRYACQHCRYSANTLGYMKIHYTRNHKGFQFSYNALNSTQRTNPTQHNIHSSSGTKVYRCLSCDYLFGNLPDMKRHLKQRHHLRMEEISALESMNVGSHSVLEVATEEVVGSQPTDDGQVQVVHIDGMGVGSTQQEQDATAALQALQYSDLDEKTASAVNILQHILDISQQGNHEMSGNQQVTVEGGDGSQGLVALNNPETIIVQQAGEEVVVSSNTSEDMPPGQYVIQYVTQVDGEDQEVRYEIQKDMGVQEEDGGGPIMEEVITDMEMVEGEGEGGDTVVTSSDGGVSYTIKSVQGMGVEQGQGDVIVLETVHVDGMQDKVIVEDVSKAEILTEDMEVS